MQMVGIRELKNKLTYYLRMTKKGDKIIVTDRGAPLAIIRGLDHLEEKTGFEERLASLAKRGMIRLPRRRGRFASFRSIETRGKPASQLIIEERR